MRYSISPPFKKAVKDLKERFPKACNIEIAKMLRFDDWCCKGGINNLCHMVRESSE